MAELSNENLPSTVSPTSTSIEPTVEESIPSREDASREDGKRKPNIGNLPENCKRMKSVQYVTQPSFEQNESKIGKNLMITILAPLPTTMKSTIKTQVLTMMTLAQSLPVIALGSPVVKGRVRVNSLSMTVQGNVTK